jgi:hypothetical protein
MDDANSTINRFEKFGATMIIGEISNLLVTPSKERLNFLHFLTDDIHGVVTERIALGFPPDSAREQALALKANKLLEKYEKMQGELRDNEM